MLKGIAEKFELTDNDTAVSAAMKGVAEGVFVGLAIVGAIAIVDGAITLIKK